MIADLKEFEKFLKLCRKHGITDVTYQGVVCKFGDAPPPKNPQQDEDEITTDELTPEQLVFYGVGARP